VKLSLAHLKGEQASIRTVDRCQWLLIGHWLPAPSVAEIIGVGLASNRGTAWKHSLGIVDGAAWRFLPDKYPSPATCWRRLKQWEEQDVGLTPAHIAWRPGWRRVAGDGTRLSWTAVLRRPKRGAAVGKTKRGKGTKWMVMSTVKVFRWEFGLKCLSGEATLAEATLKEVRRPEPKASAAKNRTGDRRSRYDSDPLRERLKKRGIELIARTGRTTSNGATKTGQAAPIQASLDHRANQRLVRTVPTTLGKT